MLCTFPWANKCTCYHSSSTSISYSLSPSLSLRTRRSLFIPGFIVRFTPPPRRLRLPTKWCRCIPTELRRRCTSYRHRRTASISITRMCRRRRRCRKIFTRCRRIIRSQVLRSRIGGSGCAAIRGFVSGCAGGEGVICVGRGRSRRVPGWGAASS